MSYLVQVLDPYNEFKIIAAPNVGGIADMVSYVRTTWPNYRILSWRTINWR